MTTFPKVFRLAAILMAALLCTSCGDGRKPVFPVHGRVFFEGKPAPGAQVVFHPPNDSEPKAVSPLGRVQEDGSFTLTTYLTNDGAPAGEYAVTITWVKEVDRFTAPDDAKPEPNRLPDRYSKLETSGLRAEIKKGTNELPPFQLTKK